MTHPAPRTPSVRARAATFATTLSLALLAQLALQLTFRQVRHPVPLSAANLEADVEVVRGWYARLLEQGTYLQMIRTELVDVVWAVLLGLTLVAIYRLVGALLRQVHPPIAAGLVRWAPLAVTGPAFDLIENAFSLAMLTDPYGFPAWWAGAHVAASWVKIVGCVLSALVGPTLTVVALRRGRRAREAANDGQALPPP